MAIERVGRGADASADNQTADTVATHSAPSAIGYKCDRRRPELGTLHQVVRENLKTVYAAAEQGFAGAPLPDFVRRDLEGYLDCGLLCRGFALLACSGCQERRLVAFSCRGRGFCPSCMGRRMAQTAANVVDHVLPKSVPLRQYVLTVPFALRARLAYDRELVGTVGRIFVDSVLGFYRRRLKDEHGVTGKSGAVRRLGSCRAVSRGYAKATTATPSQSKIRAQVAQVDTRAAVGAQ